MRLGVKQARFSHWLRKVHCKQQIRVTPVLWHPEYFTSYSDFWEDVRDVTWVLNVLYLCVYHRGGCAKSPRVYVLGDINSGTALQCLLHSSTMDEGRHSGRQKKDGRVSASHFTSPAAADIASPWPGLVVLSPMTSTGTGQSGCVTMGQ